MFSVKHEMTVTIRLSASLSAQVDRLLNVLEEEPVDTSALEAAMVVANNTTVALKDAVERNQPPKE